MALDTISSLRMLVLLSTFAIITSVEQLILDGDQHLHTAMTDKWKYFSTVAETTKTVLVKVYPCKGKMDWYYKLGTAPNATNGNLVLNWTREEMKHGVSITKNIMQELTQGEILFIGIHASYGTAAKFSIEAHTGSSLYPSPGNGGSLTITPGCENNAPGKSFQIDWTQSPNSNTKYNIFYHAGADMKEGHIMGTWCGIQELQESHHNTSNMEMGNGLIQHFESFKSSISSVCIVGLMPLTEYHFDVVVQHNNKNTAYHPVMASMDTSDVESISFGMERIQREVMFGSWRYFSAIVNRKTTAHIKLFPCGGKMDWYYKAGTNPAKQGLNWDTAQTEHGQHIVKEVVTPLDQSETLYIAVHARFEFNASFSLEIRTLTDNLYPLPGGDGIIELNSGCEGGGLHDSVQITWTPVATSGSSSVSYNLFYHPGSDMEQGHIMGTWCGIQSLMRHHMDDMQGEMNMGVKMYWEADFKEDVSTVCVTDLLPSTEYHFDVVAKTGTGNNTKYSAYQPAMITTPTKLSACSGVIYAVIYNGVCYSTLNDVPPDGTDDTCQSDYIKMPEGWSLANDEGDLIENVIASHSWNTEFLIVRGGKSYMTKKNRVPPNLYSTDVHLQDQLMQDFDGYKPRTCPYQILIEFPLNAEKLGESGCIETTLEIDYIGVSYDLREGVEHTILQLIDIEINHIVINSTKVNKGYKMKVQIINLTPKQENEVLFQMVASFQLDMDETSSFLRSLRLNLNQPSMDMRISEEPKKKCVELAEEEESEITLIAINMVIIAILIILYFLTVTPICQKISLYFPTQSVLIVCGWIIGGIFYSFSEINEVFKFSPDIFFNLLLPPMIFYSGYNLNKVHFFMNFGSILFFGMFGSLLNCLLVGSLLYGTATSTFGANIIECFVMGSLISAANPVSSRETFSKLVRPRLYNIVFGESILNDAVCIVVARIFNSALKLEESTATIVSLIPRIIGVILGSSVLGIIFGAISAKIHKHAKLGHGHGHDEHIELALMVSIAYLSFIVPEELGFSGIMSILFTGIMMDYYTNINISDKTRETAKDLFAMLSHVSESFVFVYLGMAVFTFAPHYLSLQNLLLTLFWALLIRTLCIFPFSWIANRFRKRKIPIQQQLVLCLSNVRGAVAFALAIDSSVAEGIRNVFITTTLIIIFITTFVYGSLTYPSMRLLKINDRESVIGEVQFGNQWKRFQTSHHWFVTKDRKYIRPFLLVGNWMEKEGIKSEEKGVELGQLDKKSAPDTGEISS